ncbi:MAG: ABC transporter ATP-binding protein [Flavobacteriales bacterium]|jgi:Cu-processing system ATP-binding protein|nr:ABC transporter ATP-binding protein [Flavobacteriales bacterium]
MVTINNLHKSYGALKVLDGIDIMALEKGVFAVLGPNGSGKTTLIKCILGMVIPDKGTIQINNQEVIGKWEYKEYVSYMPQIANFPPNLTIIELIEMIKTIRSITINEKKLIDMFGLRSFLHKKFSTLSGGTKQKVNIILTFMSNSPLIILDEPTTGLDPLALITFKELLLKEKEKGKTIIITSHIISLIEEISDKIVFLLDGEIFFNGSILTLKKKTKKNNLEHAIANIIQNHND